MTGSGLSGSVLISTGKTAFGAQGGDARIATGDAGVGRAGAVDVSIGSSGSGEGTSMRVQAGNSVAGKGAGGGIVLSSGAGENAS